MEPDAPTHKDSLALQLATTVTLLVLLIAGVLLIADLIGAINVVG